MRNSAADCKASRPKTGPQIIQSNLRTAKLNVVGLLTSNETVPWHQSFRHLRPYTPIIRARFPQVGSSQTVQPS